jgi:hypothetical protein
MAERDEIARLIGRLRGQIEVLQRTLGPESDLRRVVSATATELSALEARYAGAADADLPPIRTALEDLDKILSRLVAVQAPPPVVPPSRFAQIVASIMRSGSSIGLVALPIVFIVVVILVIRMGAPAWQTVAGGRAVLLLALTFAFVTFGGTLLVTPFFAESTGFEERFRRSREIFLLFAGMFSTVVGFYFAAAAQQTSGAALLMAETFNAKQGELQVLVTGGKAPYTIEVEYGEKGALKKKVPQSLETPGTVLFQFAKESDWPRPITIKGKDSADAKAEHVITPEKAELIEAHFKEPSPEQKAGTTSTTPLLAFTSKFDESAGTLDVTVIGGKPPYTIEAVYGKEKTRKLLPDVVTTGGTTRLTLNKNTDWPLPLTLVVRDAEGSNKEQEVVITESVLTKGDFKKP